ncbi:MAG TPA: ABC transporter substrate-binding protein [Methylomirabilota bacterium]|nr:ABC transporter substrate-binding protein [Methylomirabilota bacterium]
MSTWQRLAWPAVCYFAVLPAAEASNFPLQRTASSRCSLSAAERDVRRTTGAITRLSDFYRAGVARRSMSMLLDALILALLLVFAPATFVALSGVAARAQQPQEKKVYRVAFLRAGQPPKTWVEAFQQGLRERGHVDGQNVVVDFRFTDGSVDQLPRLAEELVRLKVDVIVASAAPPALAAKKVTTSVPIVFVGVAGPVELGLVRSLARPGGNITGLADSGGDLTPKRLELLRELVPKLRRVAMLWHSENPGNLVQLKRAEVAARTLGIQLDPVPVQGASDFDSAFKAMRAADALLPANAPLFNAHRARIVALADTSRLPAMYGFREMVEAGGLMSYGPHYPDLYRRAATYVDKILKGANPADLPVEQPAKFEFVINLRATKALGLTMPPSLLLRADQVIE